ncbi:MAG: tRNA (adenosine(37)-N6)-threonylcarbamoyltransferase complex ATPase subunit type 1 TsaE [Lacibacter sp.]
MQRTYHLHELPHVVAEFWQQYGTNRVFAFDGAMGSGKTTFIHALCDYLGVADPVSSPTFSLINEYETATGETILHMDWYRLNSVAEAQQAGVEDALHSGAICLVEWPQRAAALLPPATVWVRLQEVGPGQRQLQVVHTPTVS